MAGAEQRPGQGRSFGRPVFQQFEPGGTGTPGSYSNGESRGSARRFVTELIERQRLQVPDVCEYTMMWSGLAALTIHTPIAAESRIPVSPAIHQTIVHVSQGLDFVLFAELGKVKEEEAYKAAFSGN